MPENKRLAVVADREHVADFNIGRMQVTHQIAEVCNVAEKQKGA